MEEGMEKKERSPGYIQFTIKFLIGDQGKHIIK